jgi:hypothetical protein
MKEQVLSSGDRAALQSLVALAGAVGVGTIFALFFGGRKQTGYALFEVFVIVFILMAAAVTAYLGLALLHENKEIADSDLTTATTPLIVATFLLILVSMISRLPGSGEQVFAMLPIALGLVCLAAVLSLVTLKTSPENAGLVAFGVLSVGALVAMGVEAGERHFEKKRRHARSEGLSDLLAQGYLPEEKPLRFGVPQGASTSPILVHCWAKKGNRYLDLDESRRLRGLVDKRWDDLCQEEARPPVSSPILARIEIRPYVPFIRRRSEVRLHILRISDGARETLPLEANKDRVVDVTDLQLL